jgi:hypothetical protein
MGTAREQAEHVGGIGIIDRFTKDLAIKADDCVGTENNIVRSGINGLRLFGSETTYELSRRLVWMSKLGNIGRLDTVINACGKQEFVAAGGGGSENQHSSVE